MEAKHQEAADENDLRTEWLQFRSRLYDSLTGLPTLAAVAEDVRRLLERNGSAHVLYLDLGRSGWQETQVGWELYDDAVRDFARLLSSLRDTLLLSPSDLTCVDTVRSDRFLLLLTGSPGDSLAVALQKAEERRQALLAALRAALAKTAPGSTLRAVRFTHGYAHVQHDPMVRIERAVQQAVTDAMLMSLAERQTLETTRQEALTRMIVEGRIRSVFHPIVRLVDGRVIGHEALARPLDGVPFDSVEDLFAFAESTDLLMEFEALCRISALKAARDLPEAGLLFLNASARAVEDPGWVSDSVDTLLVESGLSPHDIVVEITERVGIEREEEFQKALLTFKDRGYRVAVDDIGSGHASLQALASIKPDFLKCDVSLVRGIDRSRIKQGLLESLGLLAAKMNARVIAEGVEREEERHTLVTLGIELGQGYLFHREEPTDTGGKPQGRHNE